MLQQGTFVADVALLLRRRFERHGALRGERPGVPAGYNFDFANSDVVLNRLAVRTAA